MSGLASVLVKGQGLRSRRFGDYALVWAAIAAGWAAVELTL